MLRSEQRRRVAIGRFEILLMLEVAFFAAQSGMEVGGHTGGRDPPTANLQIVCSRRNGAAVGIHVGTMFGTHPPIATSSSCAAAMIGPSYESWSDYELAHSLLSNLRRVQALEIINASSIYASTAQGARLHA